MSNIIIIGKKKYEIKNFDTGGNNKGYIDYTTTKIGKILYLSDKRQTDKRLDLEGYGENPYREIEIHKQCNKLVKNKFTSNLVKYYKYYTYNDNIIIIMDKYDGNLEKIIDKLTIEQLWSVFSQIFLTFMILQEKLGFYQGDFGLTNILYKKVNKSKKYFIYKYNGHKFKVPNEGYEIFVSDYGNALIKTFKLAQLEKEYYDIRIEKKIELYEILILLSKYMKKLNINDNKYYRNKYQMIQNFIHINIRFNLYNGYYTINDTLTTSINDEYIMNNIYNDFILK